MNEAYSILGRYFEYLNDNCDYIKWSQYIHILLNKYTKVPLTSGLDIGCGNGYFTRYFTNLGMEMTAVDSSLSMLEVAKEKAKDCVVEKRTTYIHADIIKYVAEKEHSFVLAINDCINYIPPKKLTVAFENIANSLQKGGIFLFDISTAYKFKNILDDEVFCDEKEEVAYIWKNVLKKEYLQIYLTFFIKEKNGLYRRETECHKQYIHTKVDLQYKLQQAGFKVIECTGHLGDKKDKLRANFICEKL